MINELFKPGVMGKDLKLSTLSLMNGIRENFFFPEYMQLANISSIYKSKGCRFDLESDRGIFNLPVLRKILDKLNYEDKYPHIDENMSDSNIGGRRGQTIKNHLFIIYGIINSVLVEEKSCIDIQIYDIVKAFDRLWLDDCMNDLYDSLPSEQQDDKLALIYQSNVKNLVAVNTAVGLSKRVNIEKIVTQGGVFGPLQCSNSIDTIGKKCFNTGEHLYSYKKLVSIMPLSMVDDLLAIAPCNQSSVAVNAYINAQIEVKKLKFHTPDKNGKSKCHVLHVGKTNEFCPTLQVHGTKMSHVSDDTYLGDILSSDGKNTKNINNRVGRGLGKINDVMNILNKMPLGQDYFKVALLLRESIFLNSVLTNADIWFGITKGEMKQLEDIDLSLLRNILNTPFSVPAEAVYLELGCLNIETIVKSRRLNYLHYLVKQKKTSMLYTFFRMQWKYPAPKNEWTEQVKADLSDFGFPVDLEYLEGKSVNWFKNEVKKKAKEFAFFSFLEKKEIHTKLDNLFYRELKLQKYLHSEHFTVKECQTIFAYRTRMSNYGGNFGQTSVCPLCENHSDVQNFIFHCTKIQENIQVRGNYSNLFSENIKEETAQTLMMVHKFRQEFIDSRRLN